MKKSTQALSKQEAVSLEAYQNFSTAMAAVEKTVNIRIDPKDLEILKDGDYKLCFAKKVGDKDFNVVWQSYNKYLANNTFQWTPMYQLFGSNRFEGNVQVTVDTNAVNIGLGEVSTLNFAGNLSTPVSGGEKTEFTMINEYGPIHPGVNQLSIGIDGKAASTPIYVSKKSIVKGETGLKPVEKVLVWFEQNIKTSTMFSKSRSKSIEIDLTNENSASRKYIDGKWITI